MFNKQKLSKTLLVEFLISVKFVVVGGFAALVHISIAWISIIYFQLQPLIANFIAFSCAFSISFLGQYYWTFMASCERRKALMQFFLISFIAFLVNNVALVTIIELNFIEPAYATTLAAAIIPLITYTLSRFWIFRQPTL